MDLMRITRPLKNASFTSPLLCQRLLSTHTISAPLKEILSPPASTKRTDQDLSPNLSLSSSSLHTYVQTIPPTQTQLRYSDYFFSTKGGQHSSKSNSPIFLWSAPKFLEFPASPHPEVAFVGRSNVGKSSILNALLFGNSTNATAANPNAARVSKRPGRTATMNGYGVLVPGHTLGAAAKSSVSRLPFPASGGPMEAKSAWKRFPVGGGLVVVDMPGYGGAGRAEWGPEVMKYLEKRKQLKRVYVLVNAEHGLKSTDLALLVHLRRGGIPFQVVLSKVDTILAPKKTKSPSKHALPNRLLRLQALRENIVDELDDEAKDGKTRFTDVLCCSAVKALDPKHGNKKIGIDELRWSVLSSCGFACDENGQTMKRSLEDFRILEDDP